MLVTPTNFDQALLQLTRDAEKEKVLGYDTETTCIPWWKQPWYAAAGIYPRVFSMQFSTENAQYYFDFNQLKDEHFRKINSELTANPYLMWMIANAKFDLHHSANHDVHFSGIVHCTKAIARVVNNTEESTKLDDLGEKYLGEGKIDILTELKEKGMLTMVKKYGHNDKYDEVLHFDQFPLDRFVDYGLKDVKLCRGLGIWQIQKIKEIDEKLAEFGDKRLQNVLINEQKLTKVLFKMEREGILIDRTYTEEAYEHEVREYRAVESELDQLSKSHIEKKLDWNSAKQLKPLFDKLGEPYSYTEKGNASFDKDALEESESEVAKLILKYRHHYKRAHTYFENFIWLADSDNIIHADAQQGGTGPGRMSYWLPNLQNVPKRSDKDESKYKVRRCFIPKPGTLLVDIDYRGAEYYMSMDYARETMVVEELKNGLDPHARLAKEMNIDDRDRAKTMQFRILYGGGKAAVGRALGYKGQQAETIGGEKKVEYFTRLPNLSHVMKQVSFAAKRRGWIINWLGRVLKFDSKTAYKAFNGLIQGGVGDMTKVAMVKIDAELTHHRYRSQMLLQVHDALLIKMYPDEIELVKHFIKEMVEAFPHKVLPMAADAKYSAVSWADLQDEIPSVT